jgi:mannosyl-3-phosphoglycerate phosphatase
VPENGEIPFIVIFTDLDGTLLDHDSYSWKAAESALEYCKRLDVPIILASSKTRAEMGVLRKTLGLRYPFISENGGGLFFPMADGEKAPAGASRTEDMWKLSLGAPYGQLVAALGEIRRELGWNIRGFSDMQPPEISLVTGLDLDAARLAAEREFDEPFLLEEAVGDLDFLYRAVRRRGLHMTQGGRFFHLHGDNDKGVAVNKMTSWYHEAHQHVFTAALGDSPNDFGMLKEVDYPVLIRSSRDFPGIEEQIPGLRRSREKGPRGWNTMVLNLLTDKLN